MSDEEKEVEAQKDLDELVDRMEEEGLMDQRELTKMVLVMMKLLNRHTEHIGRLTMILDKITQPVESEEDGNEKERT